MKSKASQREITEREARTERTPIQQGKILSFVTDTVFYPDGQIKTFELALHPGAVVMIPIDAKQQVVFVKQWRRAARQVLVELPAGTLELEENPLNCAQRELREEIGMRSDQIVSLGSFFTSPGFCSEQLHLFLASQLAVDPLSGDDSNEIDLITASLEEALEWIVTGKIIDAKTIVGIYRYRDWLSRQSRSQSISNKD
ncbi:MAG: NUDIX hydrolase [Chlamydiota bacterium]